MLPLTQSPDSPDLLIILHARETRLVGRRLVMGPSTAAFTVGRGVGNTLVIEDDALSRRHARFEPRGRSWWVVDLESTNGTFVNDDQVIEARLRDGDRVRLGSALFKAVYADQVESGFIDNVYVVTDFDGLTGAHNRRYFKEASDRAIIHALRHQHPLSLVMFDLDHFKRLNDTHGHLAGDHVLREIASLMLPHVSPEETLARYGGEEFALLLPETDLPQAAARAEAIRAEIEAHTFQLQESTMSVTLSAGVAQAGDAPFTAEDLLRSADEMLHAAKVGGRNRVVWE
jgi:diguanylate cyclase (GGDEF)-like protein